MSEGSQKEWSALKRRMNRKVEIIDEINRTLRRKDLEELKEIRDRLRLGKGEKYGEST